MSIATRCLVLTVTMLIASKYSPVSAGETQLMAAATRSAAVYNSRISRSTKPLVVTPVTVDLRYYIAQASGYELCQQTVGQGGQCLDNYFDKYGELVTVYNQSSTVDYTAVAGTSPATDIIGVIRNTNSTNGLRCFTDLSHVCTAPPDSTQMPEGLPVMMNLNSVPYASSNILTYGNADGSPKAPYITGEISPTQGKLVEFQTFALNPKTCAQTYSGVLEHFVSAVILTGVPFGGNNPALPGAIGAIGTQDALVIDELEVAPNKPAATGEHLERYWYVHGYGRVRDGFAYYTGPGLVFSSAPSANHVNSTIFANTIPIPPVQCQQGSQAPLN